MDHYFSVIRSTKETIAVKPNVLTYVPALKNPDVFRVRGKLKTKGVGMQQTWTAAAWSFGCHGAQSPHPHSAQPAGVGTEDLHLPGSESGH